MLISLQFQEESLMKAAYALRFILKEGAGIHTYL